MTWQPTDEELARAIQYAGRDFDKPKQVEVDVLDYDSGPWTLDEFRNVLDRVPKEYQEHARVEWDSGWTDSGGTLKILYHRLETPEEVAERVARVRAYVEREFAKERATYEALKAKFEPDPERLRP